MQKGLNSFVEYSYDDILSPERMKINPEIFLKEHICSYILNDKLDKKSNFNFFHFPNELFSNSEISKVIQTNKNKKEQQEESNFSNQYLPSEFQKKSRLYITCEIHKSNKIYQLPAIINEYKGSDQEKGSLIKFCRENNIHYFESLLDLLYYVNKTGDFKYNYSEIFLPEGRKISKITEIPFNATKLILKPSTMFYSKDTKVMLVKPSLIKLKNTKILHNFPIVKSNKNFYPEKLFAKKQSFSSNKETELEKISSKKYWISSIKTPPFNIHPNIKNINPKYAEKSGKNILAEIVGSLKHKIKLKEESDNSLRVNSRELSEVDFSKENKANLNQLAKKNENKTSNPILNNKKNKNTDSEGSKFNIFEYNFKLYERKALSKKKVNINKWSKMFSVTPKFIKELSITYCRLCFDKHVKINESEFENFALQSMKYGSSLT